MVSGATKNELLRCLTKDYIDNLDKNNIPTPEIIEKELLDKLSSAFMIENTMREKENKLQIPKALNHTQIAELMCVAHPIKKINCCEGSKTSDYDLIGIYQEEGPNKGIYITDEEYLRILARKYNYSLTDKDFKEIMIAMRSLLPRTNRCSDPNMIAVNNGIFDYNKKELLPFTPDVVFLTKSGVNYNPNAKNINIHNDDDDTDWDVDSWMDELSDDPDVVNTLWEILSAIIRPHVRWNKAAFLYSEVGNNGKGTLCTLMRNLCGESACVSMPMSNFSKEFLLEPLLSASAIITDENDVGEYIDKSANMKAVITNDPISINRKHKKPITYQHFGFMVQCLNGYPKIKDKSDSFYRRQLFIPMNKQFTGIERRYIKGDYLHRKEVLEYVLYKVLNTNFWELSTPAFCEEALNEYKEFNDPIRTFYNEMEEELVWDLIPFTFLYDLYKAWYNKYSPTGSIVSRQVFVKDLIPLVNKSEVFYCNDKGEKIKSANKMDRPEPLIIEYDLYDWKNPNYRGSDTNKLARPKLKDSYRGLRRYT